MSESFAVFLLMNNYFHDVATAMIMACCIILSALMRVYEKNSGPDQTRLLLRMYDGLSMILSVSVAWLLLSGFVRIATIREFEWANAVGRQLTAGLMVKYAIASAMVAGGAVFWARLRKRMTVIRRKHVH